jgi:hypothetical protein
LNNLVSHVYLYQVSPTIMNGKEPTRCNTYRVYSLYFNSTCFGHQYAHHQEYSTVTTALMSSTGIAPWGQVQLGC